MSPLPGSSAGRFVSTGIMHGLTVELSTVLRRTLTARGHGPTVAVTKVELMIDVPVEALGPVIPRSGAYEPTAFEPLGAVVTVWRAVVRRHFVVTIRTDRRTNSDADGNAVEAAANCHEVGGNK